MDWEEKEEMPYRKKRRRETPQKFNHKHDFETVLVYNEAEGAHLLFTGREYFYRLTKRCRICGFFGFGGDAYAKEGDMFFPVEYGAPGVANLDKQYDVYRPEEEASWLDRRAHYLLVKPKNI